MLFAVNLLENLWGFVFSLRVLDIILGLLIFHLCLIIIVQNQTQKRYIQN